MSINDIHSLSHSKWNCKYHIVFAPKYRMSIPGLVTPVSGPSETSIPGNRKP